jgi:hypothetical protein
MKPVNNSQSPFPPLQKGEILDRFHFISNVTFFNHMQAVPFSGIPPYQ